MFGATSRSERAGDAAGPGGVGGLDSFNRFSDKSLSIRLIRSANCVVFCLFIPLEKGRETAGELTRWHYSDLSAVAAWS